MDIEIINHPMFNVRGQNKQLQTRTDLGNARGRKSQPLQISLFGALVFTGSGTRGEMARL